MANRISKAVFDTGPFLHLHEIGLLNILRLFKSILIADEVLKELKEKPNLHNSISKIKNIRLLQLKLNYKDLSKLLIEKHNIDLAESGSISLALQEKADVFITDDLDARTIAKNLNLEVHGTVGVIVRAYREKIISKETAINKIKELHENSSLFITKDLVEWAVNQIKENKK